MTVSIEALSPSTTEAMIKERMAELLPRASRYSDDAQVDSTLWKEEYIELAQGLRELLEGDGQSRVTLIDWPVDGRTYLWQRLGVEPDSSVVSGDRVATETGGRSS